VCEEQVAELVTPVLTKMRYCHIRDIEQDREQGYMSLNCICWAGSQPWTGTRLWDHYKETEGIAVVPTVKLWCTVTHEENKQFFGYCAKLL
jgi:hypothetical protein